MTHSDKSKGLASSMTTSVGRQEQPLGAIGEMNSERELSYITTT